MRASQAAYRRLPTWAQHWAVTGYGWYWHRLRFGGGYQEHLDGYERRSRFSAEEWTEYQSGELRDLLSHAAKTVPYYRDTWSRAQLAAAMEGNLQALPILEKEPLRARPSAFCSDHGAKGRKLVFHSSGTSGTPLASHWTVDELRNSLALREARSARWAGTSFARPRATFSGRLVEPDPQSTGPFYRFNRVESQVYFSAFHLRAETAASYVDALHRHGTEWLTGYAVSFFHLAQFMLEQNLEPPPLRAVVTTSEKLTREMRRVMEQAYRCSVFEEYSTVDNSVFASECEEGGLHLSPDCGVVEIVRPDGTRCGPGETGEVLATCLMRRHQPFIRFRVGDHAVMAEEPCRCGRAMPVLAEIVGRIEDVVIAPDGSLMVRFHGIFVDLPGVREGQIVQEALDRIRVPVVPSPAYDSETRSRIVRRVQERLGSGVAVSVETVDEIPRTAAGKFQAVISRVDHASARTTGVESETE